MQGPVPTRRFCRNSARKRPNVETNFIFLAHGGYVFLLGGQITSAEMSSPIPDIVFEGSAFKKFLLS